VSKTVYNQLKTQFGDAIGEYIETASPFIEVKSESIREVARFCKELGFDSLMCLSAVDTKGMKISSSPQENKTQKPAPPKEEIQVVYHLNSTFTRDKIALKVCLDRTSPRLPSVSSIWGVANWHEREAYDMFGVIFDGHPALSRILCPEDWEGWPLRKDYVFPERYHDVEHKRKPSGAEFLDGEKKQ